MLMFDNVIFATFIPQILMLVGYILCLITGFQHRFDSNNELVATQNIIEYKCEVCESSASVALFSNYVNQAQELTLDEVLQSPQAIDVHVFFPEIKFSIFKASSFEQFSRPPPFCC